MSWLSKALGLDKHPAELQAINQLGNAYLHNLEAGSPIVAALINVAQEVGNNPPTTTQTLITDAGIVIAVIDPNFLQQVEGAVHNVLTRAGLVAEEAEVDRMLVQELTTLGFIKAV